MCNKNKKTKNIKASVSHFFVRETTETDVRGVCLCHSHLA